MSSPGMPPNNGRNANLRTTAVRPPAQPSVPAQPARASEVIFASSAATAASTAAAAVATATTMDSAHPNASAVSNDKHPAGAGVAKSPVFRRATKEQSTIAKRGHMAKHGGAGKKRSREVATSSKSDKQEASLKAAADENTTASKKAKKATSSACLAAPSATAGVTAPPAVEKMVVPPLSPSLPAVIAACLGQADKDDDTNKAEADNHEDVASSEMIGHEGNEKEEMEKIGEGEGNRRGKGEGIGEEKEEETGTAPEVFSIVDGQEGWGNLTQGNIFSVENKLMTGAAEEHANSTNVVHEESKTVGTGQQLRDADFSFGGLLEPWNDEDLQRAGKCDMSSSQSTHRLPFSVMAASAAVSPAAAATAAAPAPKSMARVAERCVRSAELKHEESTGNRGGAKVSQTTQASDVPRVRAPKAYSGGTISAAAAAVLFGTFNSSVAASGATGEKSKGRAEGKGKTGRNGGKGKGRRGGCSIAYNRTVVHEKVEGGCVENASPAAPAATTAFSAAVAAAAAAAAATSTADTTTDITTSAEATATPAATATSIAVPTSAPSQICLREDMILKEAETAHSTAKAMLGQAAHFVQDSHHKVVEYMNMTVRPARQEAEVLESQFEDLGMRMLIWPDETGKVALQEKVVAAAIADVAARGGSTMEQESVVAKAAASAQSLGPGNQAAAAALAEKYYILQQQRTEAFQRYGVSRANMNGLMETSNRTRKVYVLAQQRLQKTAAALTRAQNEARDAHVEHNTGHFTRESADQSCGDKAARDKWHTPCGRECQAVDIASGSDWPVSGDDGIGSGSGSSNNNSDGSNSDGNNSNSNSNSGSGSSPGSSSNSNGDSNGDSNSNINSDSDSDSDSNRRGAKRSNPDADKEKGDGPTKDDGTEGDTLGNQQLQTAKAESGMSDKDNTRATKKCRR